MLGLAAATFPRHEPRATSHLPLAFTYSVRAVERLNATAISQVLVNVIVNAFQAMPDGGVWHVIARECKIDEKEWVELTVQDSGVGIKKEELSRLFEPFYTTKAAGSGLGLAIAYRIVQDHEGTIHVSSTPGRGTTFVIRLPAIPVTQGALVRDR